MASTYWIKLYHEILDDPKMGTLPDRLYRRVIELFLLAGKFGDEGNLPDEMQISWILRIPADDLLLDLQQIESTGIIERTTEGWRVVNFAARQAPVPDAERKQRQRDREKSEQYHGTVTQLSRNVTQNTDTDTESDTDSLVVVVNAPAAEKTESSKPDTEGTNADLDAKVGRLCRIYEREIGPLTPYIRDEMGDVASTMPEEWFEIAFRAAAAQNKRSWSYVRAVLNNIRDHGISAPKPRASVQQGGKKPSLKEQNDAVVEMILNGGVK